MNITQQPDALSLSGNIRDFIIEEVAEAIPFKLYHRSSLILDELYYPDSNGMVRVKLSDLVSMLLYSSIPDYSQTVYHQPTAYGQFSVEIDEENPIDFTVVKGFLQRADFDVEQFLRFNWLTTQPTNKPVKFHDPEWLTCYPVEALDVRIRATFADGATQTITYATIEADKVQSINLNPGMIIGQFSQDPVKWDVYTETSGQQRQYTQTYRYSTQCDQYDDVFVFENRLAGIDSIRFTGVSERQDTTFFESARFDEYVVDFFAEPELAVEKNTGPISTRLELNHALDFFRSIRKHHLTRGFIAGIYLSDKPTLESVKGLLNSYTFNYSYNDFKVAYPEISIPPQLLELPE